MLRYLATAWRSVHSWLTIKLMVLMTSGIVLLTPDERNETQRDGINWDLCPYTGFDH